MERSTTELDRSKAEREVLGAEEKRLEAELERLGSELERLESERERLEVELERVEGELERLEAALKRLEPELERVEAELERLRVEVGTDIESIREKLGLDNRAQIALYALRNGLVLLDGAAPPSQGSTFRRLPALDGHDVRHLAAQQEGPDTILWVGAMAQGNQDWGCYRWQLGQPAGRWYSDSWKGGSCRALAFEGTWVYAATQWGGVLKLDLSQGAENKWQPSTQRDTGIEPGIPNRFLRFVDDQRVAYAPEPSETSVEQIYRSYKPLRAIAAAADGTLMAAGDQGILRRLPWEEADLVPGEPVPEGWDLYQDCSATWIDRRTYRDKITLPYNGLFVSGDHEIDVVNPDEQGEAGADDGNQ
jgi:hypothetical protein